MNAPKYAVGDVIHTRGGKTPWRIESIGVSTLWIHKGHATYQCRSLVSGRSEEYRLTNTWIERWTGPLPDADRKPTLLRGHGLQHEGGPFTEDRKYANSSGWNRSGEGRGLCSCGELSDVLPSASARKRWHKAHKDAIRAEQVSA